MLKLTFLWLFGTTFYNYDQIQIHTSFVNFYLELS